MKREPLRNRDCGQDKSTNSMDRRTQNSTEAVLIWKTSVALSLCSQLFWVWESLLNIKQEIHRSPHKRTFGTHWLWKRKKKKRYYESRNHLLMNLNYWWCPLYMHLKKGSTYVKETHCLFYQFCLTHKRILWPFKRVCPRAPGNPPLTGWEPQFYTDKRLKLSSKLPSTVPNH